jgi:hypothetical protein
MEAKIKVGVNIKLHSGCNPGISGKHTRVYPKVSGLSQ